MPPLEITGLRQYAVYWAKAGYDENGQEAYDAPIEIRVRWEHIQGQALTAEASPIGATIEVWVDREIEEGSKIRLGKLSEVPDPPNKLYEVIGYEETYDEQGRHPERVIQLMRLSK